MTRSEERRMQEALLASSSASCALPPPPPPPPPLPPSSFAAPACARVGGMDAQQGRPIPQQQEHAATLGPGGLMTPAASTLGSDSHAFAAACGSNKAGATSTVSNGAHKAFDLMQLDSDDGVVAMRSQIPAVAEEIPGILRDPHRTALATAATTTGGGLDSQLLLAAARARAPVAGTAAVAEQQPSTFQTHSRASSNAHTLPETQPVSIPDSQEALQTAEMASSPSPPPPPPSSDLSLSSASVAPTEFQAQVDEAKSTASTMARRRCAGRALTSPAAQRPERQRQQKQGIISADKRAHDIPAVAVADNVDDEDHLRKFEEDDTRTASHNSGSMVSLAPAFVTRAQTSSWLPAVDKSKFTKSAFPAAAGRRGDRNTARRRAMLNSDDEDDMGIGGGDEGKRQVFKDEHMMKEQHDDEDTRNSKGAAEAKGKGRGKAASSARANTAPSMRSAPTRGSTGREHVNADTEAAVIEIGMLDAAAALGYAGSDSTFDGWAPSKRRGKVKAKEKAQAEGKWKGKGKAAAEDDENAVAGPAATEKGKETPLQRATRKADATAFPGEEEDENEEEDDDDDDQPHKQQSQQQHQQLQVARDTQLACEPPPCTRAAASANASAAKRSRTAPLLNPTLSLRRNDNKKRSKGESMGDAKDTRANQADKCVDESEDEEEEEKLDATKDPSYRLGEKAADTGTAPSRSAAASANDDTPRAARAGTGTVAVAAAAGTQHVTQTQKKASFYGRSLLSMLSPGSARRPGLGKRISIAPLHPDRKPLHEVQKKFVTVCRGKLAKGKSATTGATKEMFRRKKKHGLEDETPSQRADRKRQEAEVGVFDETSEEEVALSSDAKFGSEQDENNVTEQRASIATGGKRKRVYSDCDTDEEEERLKEEKKKMFMEVDEGYA
ncbi:hypothetical protein K437DRAFT_258305 [Tilletiaria anomala UBC 951]|uniref:Uncharacterized protein n=1 Tax=Tilletiaria anomala (strain ATCC 24038 / CBS 436.72 / UBC 951) TaxID=1037660 RepID=A0A066VM26_TILAU|nr:uncharacterized protein K437DRAFT_258305 [Tilletiaria anomala UBC 951]KDN41318.1 hypothetical protein K437DRAFT_258305 [Tilletiaria anomala UBC 951]